MKKTRVLYLEIAEKIKEDIFSGKYPVGTMLPSEPELERLFDVSKITVRKAIELLAADEYVEKKSGKGTTVLSERPYNKLSKAISFTQILENSNLSVKKMILDVKKITLDESQKAYEYFGSEAIWFQRMYLLDDKPYICFDHYLPVGLKRFTKEDLEQESLYRILYQNGLEIERFMDDFVAIALNQEQQKLLQTEETIALKRIRKSYDYDQKVVEYSEAIYNTSNHAYQIEYET
ncbi:MULTISPECIES: GntR family transcriptional regulator [Enterococcus]|uniref:GntR family transcriptional regulator n=1 Tax=Enterococcus TaxID=1350 RepID=UPI000ED62093|nr:MULTISPECIES: GntR family transcriptional regulator [Enterococcus]HCM85226.1 GntR family transcriptional regulator [Enterococcus sp.]